MKNIYKKFSEGEIGSKLARVTVIITLIMVWILIDKGNIYGQSSDLGVVTKTDLVKSSVQTPSLRETPDDGGKIGDDAHDTHFEVKPNPVVDDLVFDFEFTVKEGIPYEVLDPLGRLAAQGTFLPGVSSQSIDFASFQKGMYLVRLDLGTKVEVRRIIKQ